MWSAATNILTRADSADIDMAQPELGSHPGWPLVLYFHHVRSDLDHYTVMRPAELSFALDLLSRWFRPMAPSSLAGSPADWSSEPTCLLTFDDGYLDIWQHAVPLLEGRGWRAVMFVTTSQVGLVEEHPSRGALEHMSWSHLRKLKARGHVVGNHCHSHRDMRRLPVEVVKAEISTAHRALRKELGSGPIPLAYPYGGEPDAPEARFLSGLCFGSVKAPPAPWTDRSRSIRRTFLPTGAVARWPTLIACWRRQWDAGGLA